MLIALACSLGGFPGAGPDALEAQRAGARGPPGKSSPSDTTRQEASAAARADSPRPRGVWDPNGHPFRTPAASTLEPVYRLAIVHTDLFEFEAGDLPIPGGSALDDGNMAIVELGDRFGFWIRRAPRSGFELAGAFHVGASSRFSLAGPNQDFLGIHYRAGFLLRARLGGIAARAELYHVSSHLGDEIHESSGRDPIETTREGLEVLLQAAPFRGAVLYGGPGVLLRSREFENLSVRVGAEWEGGGPEADVRPYFSGEGFLWAEHDWDPSLTLEAGAALGRIARIGVLFGTGPTRLEQFMGEGETLFGVSLSLRRG